LQVLKFIFILFFITPILFFTPFLSYGKLKLPSQLKKGKKKHTLLINGAGASFPYILYSKWFSGYRKIDPSVMINYRSIGSGGGIRQFLTGTLDFGATDVPMKKEGLKKAKKKVLHIPTTLGAVVLSYNLPSLKKDLRLTALVLADIYMGKIKKWNHEKIKAINPNLDLPEEDIIPIYRADGSGTTAVFSEYIAHFSKPWLEKVGKGKSVNWLTGIGGKGNEGVTGLIQKLPGSIGYLAMSYAATRKLSTAEIQNSSGTFVKANIDNVKASAKEMLKKTDDIFHPLITAKGENMYPLASYTYLLVYEEMPPPKGRALVEFLNWSINKGQLFCEQLHYISLPSTVIEKVKSKIQSIKVVSDDKKT